MKRRTTDVHLTIASLLALLLVAMTAAPAGAAEPKRVHHAEDLALRLTNCLRTGGKVTTQGTCKGRNSGKYSAKRPRLELSQKISNKVSWPWAKRTVKSNFCGHSLAGSTVDKRFSSAGLKHIYNGENIGCATNWPSKKMVITMFRWWQNEKSYGGAHWRQLKDKRFKSVGIGVAKLPNGRSRLVVNFYGKDIR